jgi:hypothetical protein
MSMGIIVYLLFILSASQNLNNVYYEQPMRCPTPITLFRPIAMFFGTNNILQKFLYIKLECEEYFSEKCQYVEYSSYFRMNVRNIFHKIILPVPQKLLWV